MALSFCGQRILLKRISSSTVCRRYGYIVLVPEIGEDLPDKNPLLKREGLPEFNNLTIENCLAAVGKQTLEFESGVREIESNVLENRIKDVFKDVMDPLENVGAPLDTTWGLSKTLYLGNSSLMPTKSYLSIHDRARRARATKFNSSQIYNAIKTSLDEKECNYNDEQVRILKKFELEGKLNGLNLSVMDKAKLDECVNKLVVEKDNFKRKTERSTSMFRQRISDFNIVRDFPLNLLKSMTDDPKQCFNGPWIASLQPQVCLPFMEYCPDRDLRWNMWQAMVSRGSTYGKQECSTSTNLEEIRFLRGKQANLLGYKTFADMSMETKMAGSVDDVRGLLTLLLERAKPAQERELMDLYEFAIDSGFKGERIELWDVPYWRRKQQMSAFDYKTETVQEYFPLSKVLEGLFGLCERLFKVTIKQKCDTVGWDRDVKFYDIFEQHSSAPTAGFYLDPYARTNEKQRSSGGSMVGIQNRSLIADTKPLAALIFNFQPPANHKPSLLTFKDVNLLFQKFGFALQHLLTRTSYSEVSGLSNIEWDVVEVCGHVLSHWLYNKDVIESISCHCDTEEKLPPEMFNALLSVHKHTAGLDLCRELYLSALDLELHSTKDFWLDIVRRLWPQYRCFPLDKMDAHPCSFTQIFVEEWAAAYYSHVWSRVIAADVYSAFHEVQGDEGQLVEVGKRFRDTFLALGGGCDPCEVFRKFRGRDPTPKALLSSLGLKQTKSAEIIK